MSATRVATLVAYAMALVLLAVLEFAGRRPGARVPTLGRACAAVMSVRIGRVPLGRIVLIGFWWWMGFHFFAR